MTTRAQDLDEILDAVKATLTARDQADRDTLTKGIEMLNRAAEDFGAVAQRVEAKQSQAASLVKASLLEAEEGRREFHKNLMAVKLLIEGVADDKSPALPSVDEKTLQLPVSAGKEAA